MDSSTRPPSWIGPSGAQLDGAARGPSLHMLCGEAARELPAHGVAGATRAQIAEWLRVQVGVGPRRIALRRSEGRPPESPPPCDPESPPLARSRAPSARQARSR